MTPKKEKALAALLAAPTVKAAAQAAGITDSAYRRYKKDPEFMQEYRRRCTEMLDNATSSAKAAFPPAVERLRGIVEDDTQAPQQQIAAARALLEYGLRLTEAADFEARLKALEEMELNK